MFCNLKNKGSNGRADGAPQNGRRLTGSDLDVNKYTAATGTVPRLILEFDDVGPVINADGVEFAEDVFAEQAVELSAQELV